MKNKARSEDFGKKGRVFIVHGRNDALVSAVAAVVTSLGLEPIDFGGVRLQDSFRGRYVGEVLEHAFDIAQAIIVIISGEETVRLRSRFALNEDFPLRTEIQPRPNVLIEVGMALSSHKERVIIAEFPPLRHISDLAGLVTVKFDGDEMEFRDAMSARLSQAGCSIDKGELPAPDIIQQATAFWRFYSILRYGLKFVGLGVVGVILFLIVSYWWIVPNWCDLGCQRANSHLASGDALWSQANKNSRDLHLYEVALDEYYKAKGIEPQNINFIAHVAATLNDLGKYRRTITEMSPIVDNEGFRSSYKNGAGVWLTAEVAAAYFMLGDDAKGEEYTEFATSLKPHFRDWIRNQIEKYRRQDQIRQVQGNHPAIAVSLAESIGNEMRDVELVDKAARIVVSGTSQRVYGTKYEIFACFRYDEPSWWCRRAVPSGDGAWTANLYPTGLKPPFMDGSEIEIMAVVDTDGGILSEAKKDEEFPETDLERYAVRSIRKRVKVFLKGN